VQRALDLYASVARQRRHRHRRARRVGFLEVLRHELVDLGKVREVGQEDGDLDYLRERATGSGDHGLDVLENAARFLFEIAFYHLHGGGIERDLPREVQRVARAHRL